MTPEPLLTILHRELTRAADPAKAPTMQAYMKSAMPYLGVSAPVMRAVCKRVFAGVDLPTRDAFYAAVLAIWRGAQHREERYTAIELSGHRSARAMDLGEIVEDQREQLRLAFSCAEIAKWTILSSSLILPRQTSAICSRANLP
jgi:DNA alkylation repair enzyme